MGQQVEQIVVVAVKPEIINSLAAIAERFGRDERLVKAWYKEGAPIACEGRGNSARYSAEVNALQAWRVGRRGKSQ